MSWSDDAIRKLQNTGERQQEKDALFLERQRLKKSHGFPLWREVRKAVQTECVEFNKKAHGQSLTFEVTVEREISVVANLDGEHRQLNAHFAEDTGVVSWMSGFGSGEWQLGITPNGDVQFFLGKTPTTSEAIKNQMLQALVFGEHL
jgi:hypothetical protein